MAYTKEISRDFKGCFLFLLDQSRSMEEPLGNSTVRKCDSLATALNAWIQNMAIRATNEDGIRHWVDIGVLGYTTDEIGNPIIEACLQGPMAGKKLASITEIANNPLKMETVTQKLFDDETGDLIEMEVEMPVWIEPKIAYGTPMCQAFHDACTILDEWIADHQASFPPIVIHITDGESSDGDPIPYAEALKERSTDDGNVLLLNCHLSMTAADSFMFPSSSEVLPDELARVLFEMSSVLPDSIFQRAVSEGQELKPNARGMAFNADMVALIKFLDMGTRVASPAPQLR